MIHKILSYTTNSLIIMATIVLVLVIKAAITSSLFVEIGRENES